MQTPVLPNRIRELRKSQDKKLADIAVAVDRDVSTIHRWETKGGMREQDMLKLASELGVPVAVLMGWDTEEAA